MPIINRDLQASQQKACYQDNFTSVVAAGNTYIVSFLPTNGLVTGVFAAAVGISNTPALSFWLYRFLVGQSLSTGVTNAGYTFIGLGATLTVPAFGTSGWAFYGPTMNGLTTSNVIGITCLQGDFLVAQLSGSNAALTTAVIGGIVKATDAFLQWPG